jgi:porin
MKHKIRKQTVLARWTIALAVLSCVSRTVSEENSVAAPPKSALEQFAEQDYLFGTWGGLRTQLSKRGIDFELFYIASNPHNISGGIQPGSAYEGAFLMLLDLDSQKLAGYDGGHFHVGGVWLHGQDHFSDIHIGDLNKVNLIDFPNSARLWELWYEQKFWGDTVSLKVGQMAVDQDFIVAEYYNSLASINLLNQTFFYPTLAFNVYNIPGFPGPLHALPSSPYGAPGARLKVKATEQLYFQVAGYDGYPDQDSGTQFKLNGQQGALVYGEVGYRFNQLKSDTGLPGNLKLGGWYHTSDFPDNLSVFQAQLGLGPVRLHPNTYGGYFLADQTLYREIGKDDPAQQGLIGFFRLTGAPADRNLTQFGVDGGLVYRGLIPKRDWDTIAVAGSYLEMSRDIRKGQELINSAAPGTFPDLADYEAAFEITYKAQMTAWWTLQLGFERAIHPGGHTAIAKNPSDAWAFILASTLRF